MSLRLTGILALLCLVLGLLIAVWDRDDDTTRSRLEEARRAFQFDAARVDRLLIDTPDLSLECRLVGNRWSLVRPMSARTDPAAIERLLGALRELSRGDLILPPRRAPDPYGPYGLNPPRATVSIIAGAVTNRILIGRRSPLGDGLYARLSGHDGVARLDAALLDLIPADVEAIRDRSLLRGETAGIDRFDIRTPAGYLQLARAPHGDWRLFQPVSARADQAGVAALIDQLLAASVVQFVQDGVADLAPYGLDAEMAVTAVLNTESGDGSQMLALGDVLPNATNLVYARLDAEDSVYAVPAAIREALQVRPDDLRARRLPVLADRDIRRLRISGTGLYLDLARDESGAWQLEGPVSAPANPEAVDGLLRTWADLRLLSFEDQPPADAPLLYRTWQVEWSNADRPPLVLRMGPVRNEPGQIRIAIDGDSGSALAAPADLFKSSLDPLVYRSRNLLSIPAGDIVSLTVTTPAQSLELRPDSATGEWPAHAAWVDRLLPQIDPLRAAALLAHEPRPEMGLDAPILTVAVRMRGESGLAATLRVGAELSPGGPRWATLNGRHLVFSLTPDQVEALSPPPPEDTP